MHGVVQGDQVSALGLEVDELPNGDGGGTAEEEVVNSL